MTTTGSLAGVFKRMTQSTNKLVTPRIDHWLTTTPEGTVLPPEMMPLVESLLTSSANSERVARFGASSRGNCQRQQVFGFLGMSGTSNNDSVLQNIFNDGTWRHLRWQMSGIMAGVFQTETWDVPNGKIGTVETSPVEVRYALPQYHTKVSIDAINSVEGWGFELKGTGYMQGVLKDGVPPKHLLQIHTYFIATGFDTFVYLAEDKRTNDWVEFTVHPDKAIMAQTKAELNALSDAVEDKVLPPVLSQCAIRKGDDYRACPFRDNCITQQGWPTNGTWSS